MIERGFIVRGHQEAPLFLFLQLACTPEPTAPAVKPADIRSVSAPSAVQLTPSPAIEAGVDLKNADPMVAIEEKGPSGVPSKALSLIVASRGDGEIEPCG